jgi:UDP-N-acetyl-D-galactosamine dehydrogenase
MGTDPSYPFAEIRDLSYEMDFPTVHFWVEAMSEKIAVIGLGYVGLPLLIKLNEKFDSVIGFDIDEKRVEALSKGRDWTDETSAAELTKKKLNLTVRKEDLVDCTFFIAAVPTPIDHAKRPDLTPVLGACQTIGEVLKLRGDKKGPVPLAVFESTVWPGLTEEYCGAKIEEFSGLKRGEGFRLGYSPERINPGDKNNRLETIIKIVSAEDPESLDRVEKVYSAVVTAGLHRAESIKVAETAKVLENTQRDLNVALMNELALICDRLDIRTRDVLKAAGTKWNFLKFTPGLVGGHCIGVDPYYLTTRAEELGYHPHVILAGRRINDDMPVFIAQKLMKLMSHGDRLHRGARVGVLGLSFKENVRDIRNSRVPEIVKELTDFGLEVLVHDPVVDPAHAKHEYGIELVGADRLNNLDALVLAVSHEQLLAHMPTFLKGVVAGGVVADVKAVLDPTTLPRNLIYWSL